MRSFTALAIIASGLIAGTAMAQTTTAPAMQTPPPAMRHHGGMMRADADHDGTVTRAEAIAQANARFDAMDTNKDGKVTAEERDAARAAMWARRSGGGDKPAGGGYGMRGDPSGDGVLTREEAVARATKRFDRLDTNRDGKLDAAEMAAGRPRRGPRPMTGNGMAPPADAPAQ